MPIISINQFYFYVNEALYKYNEGFIVSVGFSSKRKRLLKLSEGCEQNEIPS